MGFPDQQQQQLPVRYSYNYQQPGPVVMNGGPTPPSQLLQKFNGYPYQQPSQQSHYANKGGSTSAPASPPHVMSPYKVLPPVGKSSSAKDRPTDAPAPTVNGGGSYMDQYRRQKKRPDYKTYTVDDYRKLKKEMKLNMGALGPDMENETLKERKEKVQRQQEYAQLIRERNKMEIQPRQLTSRNITDEEAEDQLNKRRLALEYAKQIPKPKRRVEPSSTATGSSNNIYQQQGALPGNDSDSAMDELRRLQERHQWEREQVARLLQGTALPTS